VASSPRAAASPSSFLAAGSHGRVWRRAGLHSFHSAMSDEHYVAHFCSAAS